MWIDVHVLLEVYHQYSEYIISFSYMYFKIWINVWFFSVILKLSKKYNVYTLLNISKAVPMHLGHLGYTNTFLIKAFVWMQSKVIFCTLFWCDSVFFFHLGWLFVHRSWTRYVAFYCTNKCLVGCIDSSPNNIPMMPLVYLWRTADELKFKMTPSYSNG